MVRESQLSRARAQHGDVLLITLLVMTLMALGMLYAMRFVVTDTVIAGNTLARQKGGQASDIGLRFFQQTELAPYAALNQDLVSFASGEAWMNVDPLVDSCPAGIYSTSLWQSVCPADTLNPTGVLSPPLNQFNFTLPASATWAQNYRFSAMVFPLPVNANSDSCGTAMQMRYYDVFIRAEEFPGITSATSETVFNLCAY